MTKLKMWIMVTGMCILLAGCSAGLSEEKIAETNGKAEETSVEYVKENATEVEQKIEIWSDEMKWDEIAFLENYFGDGMNFETMDEDVAESYGAAIKDSYDFIGRMTDDGYGYVLGFKKGNNDPFAGYDQYWKDGEFTVVKVNEKTWEETTMFTLPNIENIYFGENNDILYIHPNDLEETEQISIAFSHQYCNGEDGKAYLNDTIARGVRFTSPDFGAYLSIYRFENGKQRWEYIPLTKEEENEILHSDALILPEWYGHYGIEFFVSEEVYEETGRETGAITDAALKIAEERCNFTAMGISEIRDIVGATFEMKVWDEENGDRKIEIQVTDEATLKELEEIFSGAEVFHEGKCPYTGILTLKRDDGKELVLSLATDSCNGFVFGSCGMYAVDKEKTERIWEIFDEARAYTGW